MSITRFHIELVLSMREILPVSIDSFTFRLIFVALTKPCCWNSTVRYKWYNENFSLKSYGFNFCFLFVLPTLPSISMVSRKQHEV
jgi:hypothetical protein